MRPRGYHHGFCVILIALLLILAAANTSKCVQRYIWTERQPAGNVDKYWRCAASSLDGAKLFVGAGNGRLYTSTDTGATWTECQPAGDTDWDWVCLASSSDGTRLVAGVYGGRLYTSQDGGVSWIERKPAGDADYYWTSVASSSDGVKLISSAFNDYLYTSTDIGVTWTERQAGGSIQCWFCSASSSDGSKLIAGSYCGRLYTSTNSGVTWNETQPAGDVDKRWRCTASSSDGAKLIVGADLGRLYTSTDAGLTWTERQPVGNGNVQWACVASSSDGTKLISGLLFDRLYTSADAGATWTEQQPAGDEWRLWAGCAASSSDGNKLIVGSCDGVYDIYDGRLYTGTLQAFFTISGYVRTSDSTGISSVVMNGLPGNPLTDTNGYYTAEVDSGWSGIVTPAKEGYSFNPESASYSNVMDNQETNYTGTLLTYTISGHVFTSDSTGIDSVLMSGLPDDLQTDTDGYYTASVDYGWSGIVTPAKEGYSFNPESTSYSSVTDNQETDYTGTLLTYTISGYVRNSDSVGVSGIVMSGLPGNPQTDGDGFYTATVDYGWSGRVTPTDTCVFDPEYRDYDSVTSDQTDQNYVEECFSEDVDEDKDNLVPKEYHLSQNHPNPFNPTTEIVFGLPKANYVNLRIYNIVGQEVVTLIDRNLSAGTYHIRWYGVDGSGRAVSSGVYFYRMQAGDYVQTRQMLLLK